MQAIAVDAHGSVALGGSPAPRRLTGIGASKRSAFATPDLYDAAVLVGDAEAFAYCRALAVSTAIEVGSSGGTLAPCARTYRFAGESNSRHPQTAQPGEARGVVNERRTANIGCPSGSCSARGRSTSSTCSLSASAASVDVIANARTLVADVPTSSSEDQRVSGGHRPQASRRRRMPSSFEKATAMTNEPP
jgi:hypothetical protein